MSLTVPPKLGCVMDLVQFSTSQISPFLLTYFLRLEQFKIEDISLCSIRKIKDNRWLSLFVKTLFTSHAAMFVCPANRKYVIYGNYNVPRYIHLLLGP